jgi:hypothetical protein
MVVYHYLVRFQGLVAHDRKPSYMLGQIACGEASLIYFVSFIL